jgi:hypothetical protein
MDKEVHIQRASLTITLTRPGAADAPEVRREDAALFLKTLHRTINICTRNDVKVSEASFSFYLSGKGERQGQGICGCSAADKSSFRLAKTSSLGTFSRCLPGWLRSQSTF